MSENRKDEMDMESTIWDQVVAKIKEDNISEIETVSSFIKNDYLERIGKIHLNMPPKIREKIELRIKAEVFKEYGLLR